VPDPAFAWTVREVVPGGHLVLELKSPPGWFTIHTTWTLVVRPAGDSRSRLVERSWWDVRPRAVGVPFSLAFEVVDFVMMRKHLLGVRSRAAAAGGEPPDISFAGAIENSIEIDRPPEEVFAYLTDLHREHEWNEQLRHVEALTDGPLQAGSRYRVRFGRAVGDSVLEYRHVDPPRSWRSTSVSRRLDVEFAGTIGPVPRGSRVTLLTKLLPRGPLRLARPLLDRTMRKSWDRHLRLVKSILEGEPDRSA
jgi:uncharacterized protein YndB with AHSA1/START domain